MRRWTNCIQTGASNMMLTIPSASCEPTSSIMTPAGNWVSRLRATHQTPKIPSQKAGAGGQNRMPDPELDEQVRRRICVLCDALRQRANWEESIAERRDGAANPQQHEQPQADGCQPGFLPARTRGRFPAGPTTPSEPGTPAA